MAQALIKINAATPHWNIWGQSKNSLSFYSDPKYSDPTYGPD